MQLNHQRQVLNKIPRRVPRKPLPSLLLSLLPNQLPSKVFQWLNMTRVQRTWTYLFAFNECHSCRILAENILHESLKIKLSNLRPGPNTRQLCRAGINKIKDMIRKVGWVPQKGILYVIPTPEHAERCAGAFLDYDFSKVVSKVSK